ncbi:MAG TPA: hypothetical protein VGH47_15920 [Xanthobacteraceae bacterium]|jgi:hypothetical protein
MTLQEPHREPRRPVTGKANFRDLAVQLLAANPEQEVSDLVGRYVTTLRSHPAALESLAEFALLHVKATIMPTKGNGTRRAAAPLRQERKRRAMTTAKEIIKNLMEFKTPYGKATADCSGEELWKLGGWYRALSKLAGGRNSNKTLREQGATEADLKNALKAA